MIIQAGMLRGKARSVMQQEIRDVVVEVAAIERDTKKRKQLHPQPDETSKDSNCLQLCYPSSHLPMQDADAVIAFPLGQLISDPYLHEKNAKCSEAEKTDKVESFDEDIFAPSCMCGWPLANCTCTVTDDA